MLEVTRAMDTLLSPTYLIRNLQVTCKLLILVQTVVVLSWVEKGASGHCKLVAVF